MLFRLYPDESGKRKFFTLVHGEDLTLWIRGDKEESYDDLGTCCHKRVAAGENYFSYFEIARSGWQPAYFGPAGDFAAWKADRDAGLLVIDPCLDWGSNLSHIEEYVKRKNWWDHAGDELFETGNLWGKAFWVADSLIEQYEFETQDVQNLMAVV